VAGSIRITDRRIFFLPQRPCFTNGSLREQVCYPQEVLPGAPDAAQHARILAMFTMTGMTGQIRPRLDNSNMDYFYLFTLNKRK
jgi:ABC-type uncharacterized transport system fused permease/ATPase subunit